MAASALGRVLLHPFRAYEELANDTPSIAEGVARLLFVVGAVVALTAAGRLAPIELVVAMVSFAYVPAAQFLALSGALFVVARKTPRRRAFALYLAGQGPWVVTLLLLATLCFVSPSPSRVLFTVTVPLVLFTFGWRAVVNYACFTRGLGLTRGRAAAAAALQFALLVAVVVGYYLAMGQLGPQIWR